LKRFPKRRLLIAGGIVAVLLAGAGVYAAYRMHQSRNIVGSSTKQFTTTAVPVKPVTANPQGVVWPMWGYDGQRLRAPTGIELRPPFRKIWTFHGRALLEFPPAVAYGKLYLTTFWGHFYALNEKTGKPVWTFDSGRCGWSSPAVADHVVYQTFIGHPDCNRDIPGTDGEVVALNARNGNGNELALDAKTGKLRWSFHTDGKIKGSAAIAGPNIVVGSYDGHVYALNALTGKEVWRAAAQPRLAGALGTFYSTPAVAYGRVYIGNTDDKIYAYGAATGDLLWSRSTGGYVYSSPAVSDERVYAGSYDGSFYALSAATGETIWTFHAKGAISGAPTVLDGIVYFSTFDKKTYGLDAKTGKLVWTFPDGKYSPVVADTKRLYLVGFGRMYGLVPTRKPTPTAKAPTR
jgi:outer membrane protein assembly factor BamB